MVCGAVASVGSWQIQWLDRCYLRNELAAERGRRRWIDNSGVSASHFGQHTEEADLEHAPNVKHIDTRTKQPKGKPAGGTPEEKCDTTLLSHTTGHKLQRYMAGRLRGHNAGSFTSGQQ